MGSPADVAPDPRPLVLVVDDEDMIRSLVRSVLEANGCRVVEADCARGALEWAERGPDPIDLVVTDVRMPGQTGPELARALRVRRPELPIVFISGYAGESPIDPTPSSTTEYLAKPFPLPSLVAAVRRLLEADRVAV
jgi:CheY-like chemotaxis protein